MSDPESFAHADSSLNQEALLYHAEPGPGKTSIRITKPAETQKDLSLAYTPGVAEPVRRIGPTFGGINLEDIAAPNCFEIEQLLIEELDIPVFHDDQHGTAIIIASGLLNALELQGKRLEDARIAVLGAGAAGIRPLMTLGAHRSNIFAIDRQGVIHTGRRDLNAYKFGIAAVHALKDLTHEPVPDRVLNAHGIDRLTFGPEYIIPKPLDPRLRDAVSPAVARAAVESGVARAPYPAHYPRG